MREDLKIKQRREEQKLIDKLSRLALIVGSILLLALTLLIFLLRG